jgi:hypothetical protein
MLREPRKKSRPCLSDRPVEVVPRLGVCMLPAQIQTHFHKTPPISAHLARTFEEKRGCILYAPVSSRRWCCRVRNASENTGWSLPGWRNDKGRGVTQEAPPAVRAAVCRARKLRPWCPPELRAPVTGLLAASTTRGWGACRGCSRRCRTGRLRHARIFRFPFRAVQTENATRPVFSH